VSAAFDRRLTPARPDLAAEHLRGKVEAARFVQGRTLHARRGIVDLRRAPEDGAGLETQILFGEAFTVYEESGGWVWGQGAYDSYVGYARAADFAAPVAATHRVVAWATPLLWAGEVKSAARDWLPMNAKLAVRESGARFVRLAAGFVFAGHVAPIESGLPDWVAVAESFQGVPYLWGGKTNLGCDCSGLIQTALEAAGIRAPRDTDMMEEALGRAVARDGAFARGDLLFWNGHMGVMLDAERLLHANAHFMQVTAEPLSIARARIAAAQGADIRTVKRL
jgi:Bacterial dipeptidyl-peptidase Sh3 domain/NlpC/P60 family